MSFWKLLACYFWPIDLLKNASKGNVFERSAAFTHNREQAKYLPIYMRRWAVVFVVMALISNLDSFIAIIAGIIATLAAAAIMLLLEIWLKLKNDKDKL